MHKLNRNEPFGQIIPPREGRFYQQNGCFYGVDDKFTAFDTSTAQGKMLKEVSEQRSVKKVGAAAETEQVTAVTDKPADNPPAQSKPAMAVKDGAIDPATIPDESGDDVTDDGVQANNDADNPATTAAPENPTPDPVPENEDVAALRAYMAGGDPIPWHQAVKMAEKAFGERPKDKDALREMLGEDAV